ncbi:MAG: dTDP-4-dehydrorhamnose reductase [Duodenibacillus sp.]
MEEIRVLVYGADGQVGSAVTQLLARMAGVQVMALSRHSVFSAAGRMCRADLTHPEEAALAVEEGHWSAVFNCAAMTAVDAAEDPSCVEELFDVNTRFPVLLHRACKRRGVFFVHLSTDYVYAGMGDRPQTEETPMAPLNAYGRSKAEADRAILEDLADDVVLRTSWIVSEGRRNFLRTMLTLARSRTDLAVVRDQIGTPTTAEWLADIMVRVMEVHLRTPGAVRGIYHAVPDGEALSWHAFARWIVERARRLDASVVLKSEDIAPITSTDYGAPALRPMNSRLANDKLKAVLGDDAFGDWPIYVERTLRACIKETHS